MPYTKSQCAKFATMKNPPADWKEHCKNPKPDKPKKIKRRR